MSKKIIALVLAALMTMALLAACSGGGGSSSSAAGSSGSASGGGSDSSSGGSTGGKAEFEFNVNYTVPEANGVGMKEYCDRIEEQSERRITFNHYYANSLLSIAEIPKGLQDGIADLSYIPLTNYQEQFPLNAQIMEVPFLGLPGIMGGSDIFAQLYEEFPELTEEMTSQGITPVSTHPNAPYQIMMAKDISIASPADFSGLKIITSSTELSELIMSNNGAPIAQPPTEYYNSLEKGVADGVINHLPAGLAFGILPELTEKVILFGEAGLFMNFVVAGVRTESLEKLPEDLQELFFGDNAAQFRAKEDESLSGVQDNCLKMQEDAGKEIVELTDDDIKAWQDATADYREATIAALEADGHAVARDIYDRAIELIAEHNS